MPEGNTDGSEINRVTLIADRPKASHEAVKMAGYKAVSPHIRGRSASPMAVHTPLAGEQRSHARQPRVYSPRHHSDPPSSLSGKPSPRPLPSRDEDLALAPPRESQATSRLSAKAVPKGKHFSGAPPHTSSSGRAGAISPGRAGAISPVRVGSTSPGRAGCAWGSKHAPAARVGAAWDVQEMARAVPNHRLTLRSKPRERPPLAPRQPVNDPTN